MKAAPKEFDELQKMSLQASILEGISALLGWDQETYMPKGAAGIRAEQLQLLAGLIHKERTGEKFGKALEKLIDLKTGTLKSKTLNGPHAAALRAWRRDYIQATALPTHFVEDFAKLTSQSLEVWRHARKENSYSKFAPYLEKVIEMSRKKAEYLGYEEHPYDALLDSYEEGMTVKTVEKLFNPLEKGIVSLIHKIQSKKQVSDSFLFGKFSEKKQLEFGNVILKDMGYDMDKGRLDLSTHPFSSASHPTDSRITTRFHHSSLMNVIHTIMHEAGHGMYEMGLPVQYYGTPLGQAISLGVHESQSRWWETRIGLSKPFWKHYLPIFKGFFKGRLDDVTLNGFYKAINKVEPGLIRVEADEVTYPLHVILRFNIEKRLIEGSLTVRDLPEAWNGEMERLLGVIPPSNSDGCLQDIHWSMGGFGYFPTYTLGNMYAAHFFQKFGSDHPEWESRLAKGEILFIKEWLNDAVYQHGRRYTSLELLKKVTGKAFTSDAYTKYLTSKYKDIYNFS